MVAQPGNLTPPAQPVQDLLARMRRSVLPDRAAAAAARDQLLAALVALAAHRAALVVVVEHLSIRVSQAQAVQGAVALSS